jgi:hypothetical protein
MAGPATGTCSKSVVTADSNLLARLPALVAVVDEVLATAIRWGDEKQPQRAAIAISSDRQSWVLQSRIMWNQ